MVAYGNIALTEREAALTTKIVKALLDMSEGRPLSSEHGICQNLRIAVNYEVILYSHRIAEMVKKEFPGRCSGFLAIPIKHPTKSDPWYPYRSKAFWRNYRYIPWFVGEYARRRREICKLLAVRAYVKSGEIYFTDTDLVSVS